MYIFYSQWFYVRVFSTRPRPRPGSLEARILALQEDNIRTLATSPLSLSPQATPPHPDVATEDGGHKTPQPKGQHVSRNGKDFCLLFLHWAKSGQMCRCLRNARYSYNKGLKSLLWLKYIVENKLLAAQHQHHPVHW